LIKYFFPPVKNSPPKQTVNQATNNMITITSVFPAAGIIPDQYGCRGQNINPPLDISGIPAGAKGLALIIDDPDAPSGDWVHWLLWNIDPQTAQLAENSIPTGAVVGLNSYGSDRYEGPCPPSGTHHYQFKIYALDSLLDLSPSADKPELLAAMAGHILGQAILTGTY
jgi:Raf kinase inhibitor-like YbhB/YbcL family protein